MDFKKIVFFFSLFFTVPHSGTGFWFSRYYGTPIYLVVVVEGSGSVVVVVEVVVIV